MSKSKIETIVELMDALTDEESEELNRLFHNWKLLKKNQRREITIVIKGHQFFHEVGKPSEFNYVLIDEETGVVKRNSTKKLMDETTNRAIILGIIEAIDNLHKELNRSIHIYSKGPWGFDNMKNRKKCVNGDLLEKLNEIIKHRNYRVEAHVDAKVVDSYL